MGTDAETLARQLRDAQAALERARRERAEEAADAAYRFRMREAELGIALDEAVALKSALEYRLTVLEAARQPRGRQASLDPAAAERLADLDERLAGEVQRRTDLEGKLAEAQAALQHADEQYKLDAAAAGGELARCRAEFAATIADIARSRNALTQELTDISAALNEARERHAEQAAASAAHLAHRESELGAMLAEAAAIRTMLESRLAEAEEGRRLADERASMEQALGAGRVRDLETALADAQRELERAVVDADTARQAAAARLARRESELGAALAEASEARTVLECRLADAGADRERADERASLELAAAAERLADVESRLARESDRRSALEGHLADARLAAEEARRRSQDEITAVHGQMSEREAELSEGIVRERAAHERRIADKDDELRRTELERQSLDDALDAARGDLARLGRALKEERESHDRERMAAEHDRARLSALYAEAQGALEQVRAEFQALACVASEHAAEVARLGALVTERDAQLRDSDARHRSSQQAASEAIARIKKTLDETVESGNRTAAELQSRLDALGREQEAIRKERDGLRITAARLPDVQNELDRTRAETVRHFEQTPYGICRLRRDGRVVRVNRGLARLLGYRAVDELRELDFAARVFESPDDLRWLVECCLTGAMRESVETTWRRRNGSRCIVRLLAFAVAADSVEIIAEDITGLRATEERLRQAQRMEAVGRLASEVAVTCNRLLRDVTDEGHQWLTAMDAETLPRRQGERLLAEVKRVGGFLRQLEVYGEQQTRALKPVDVHDVLRGLEPVLKRVAGDEIDFVLPRSSRPIHIDLAAERVERILVNVASYARQRMPSGGRLRVDLARAVVDRKFLAKYPNVRPGEHALIIVTEENGRKPAPRPNGHGRTAGPDARLAPDRPGVELAVLLELVGSCRGHLWMAAEPSGSMVLKIYLPQRVADAQTDAHSTAARSLGERAMARLFPH